MAISIRLIRLMSILLLSFVHQIAFAQNSDPVRSFEVHVGQDIPGSAQQIWDDYVFSTVNTRSLQAGCEPVQMRPSPNVAYRGVIILLHGFTSCPKQYWEMAKAFNAQGYHVLIPLLPGHGGSAPDELDAQTFLPGSSNWFNYDAFARWINALAGKIIHGEVHIGGLCLGGTIAMRAMQLKPALYQRSVLLSPFFEVSTRLLGRLGRLMGRVKDVMNVRTGLGLPIALSDLETCEGVERRQMGRAGYCRTRLDNLVAVARFAHFVKQNMHTIQTQIQTIIVDNDPVAHPQVTLGVLERHTILGMPRTAACVMAESATHSFFSTTDLPMPKPWLPQLHQELTDFIKDKKQLIVGPSSKYVWSGNLGAVQSCSLWP